MPIIDVFIAMTLKRKGTNPKTGAEEDLLEREAGGKSGIPEWGKLQALAALNGSTCIMKKTEPVISGLF